MISMLCAMAMTSPIMCSSAMAIKEKQDVSSAASKKISDLNEIFAKHFEKLKQFKNEVKALNESKNLRLQYFVNCTIKEIDKSIGMIEMLDSISIDDSIVKVEIQDDLNVLSSKIRVLGHFLKRCKLNEESKNIEFMEAKEEEQGQDELLPDEISKLKKDLETGSVENVLLQTTMQVRDELNNIKNKIKIVADNKEKQVTHETNKSDISDNDSELNGLFSSIDQLYNNSDEESEDETIQIINMIRKAFPGRKRAMVAFDVLNKYKDKKIDREEMIRQLVEPVVRKEMELSSKRFFEEGGPLLKSNLKSVNINQIINSSIELAIKSKANSLYEFCCVAFYGTNVDNGFYDSFKSFKSYWYNQFDRSKDFILCPVIMDIVELNSLVRRLEELEHVGIDADNIRKTSKIFDKILNDCNNEDVQSIGMYRHLTNKGYGEKECDEEYEELCVGDDTLLNELMDNFYNFINDMPFNSNAESKVDIKKKTHDHIAKIKSTVQKIDEKYSKISEENPEFSTISQKDEFKKSRIELYTRLYFFESNRMKYLDRLPFNLEIDFMDSFKKNKVALKKNKITTDEFIKSFDVDATKYTERILPACKLYIYFIELDNFKQYIKQVTYGQEVLFQYNSIIGSILYGDFVNIMQYGDYVTDQQIMLMQEEALRAVVDMKNIKENSFILEHEIRYARFCHYVNNLGSTSNDYSHIFEIANQFRSCYQENRHNLKPQEPHLKVLAREFKILLSQIGFEKSQQERDVFVRMLRRNLYD